MIEQTVVELTPLIGTRPARRAPCPPRSIVAGDV
jgi:hypothetical protein